MGRLVGYVANRSDRLRDPLYQEREALRVQDISSETSGWGIGFYHGDEVLHKKRPMRAGDRLDWEQIAGNVRSDCAVLHLEQPPTHDFRAENAHPFRLRRWLFAHRGAIAGFESLREGLAAAIPDFLRRNIRGDTDSEYLFHMLLTFLHEAGQLDNRDVGEAQVIAAISATVALIERLGAEIGQTEHRLSFILTNGRSMYAFRHRMPMAYVQRNGLHDAPDDYVPPPSGSTPLRYVMVTSGVDGQPTGYESVPDRAIAVIDRELHVSVHEL